MERNIINELISCPKTVKVSPKRQMTADARNNFTLRNDFSCVSEDGKVFEVFLRCNTHMPQMFSIGLRYKSDQGTITICRYNGKHPHRNKVADKNQLDDFHIHKIYDSQLADASASSMDAEPTTRYITFDEALYAFLTDCNILNWQEYFPNLEETVNQLRWEGV